MFRSFFFLRPRGDENRTINTARLCHSHEVMKQDNKNDVLNWINWMKTTLSSNDYRPNTTEDRQFINANEFEWQRENENTIYLKIELNMHVVMSNTPHSIDTYLRRANIQTVFSLSPYLFDTCICLCPPPARYRYADTTFYVCHVCRV